MEENMTTAEDLRKHCERLRKNRKEELKLVLDSYFKSMFIEKHRPFRAVIGNKRCKPIPIYRDFRYSSEPEHWAEFEWPNLSEELLRKELENLGFVLTKNEICISVPPCEKGAELSFAQMQVKKINAAYSEFCVREKKHAKKIYSEYITSLKYLPDEKIKTYDGYTVFDDRDIPSSEVVEPKCRTYFEQLLVSDRLERYYENGSCAGLKVNS